MEPKFIQVTLAIDCSKPEQITAMNSLLQTIGKSFTVNNPAGNTDPNPPAPGVDGGSRKAGRPKKEDPQPEAPAAEAVKEDPQPEVAKEDPAPAAEEAPQYKIEEVREKLKEKVGEHREEIKAKLAELGAPNVSNLDPEKYSEFMDFLNTL